MSSTVRCPGCALRFQVASGQLDVANGWVRCGACQQVFDAARQVASSAAQKNQSMHDRRNAPSPWPAGNRLVTDVAAPLLRRVSSDESGSEPDGATDFYAAAPNSRPGNLSGHAARPATARNDGAACRTARQGTASTWAPVPAPDHQTVSFMHGAHDGNRHASFASLRWLVYLAALLLSGVLLAQVMLQHRDWLAARAPALELLLQPLCHQLGCTVGPPRQIDALVIGNSSLTKLGETGYRLSLAVRNQADTSLAMPSVELTLTDAADRTLVRRVLMPADLGAAESIVARGEWTGALTFALVDARERIAGYRVTTFYP